MLGDGHISKLQKDNSNSCFTKNQRKRNLKYLNWHLNQLEPYSLKVKKIYSDKKLVWNKSENKIERIKIENRLIGYNFLTHCHPVFTELRKKWYPDGIKIVPKDLELNPEIIAIWFADDGSNYYAKRQITIYTEAFTLKEAKFLCEQLKKFDINPRIEIRISKKSFKKQPLLIICGNSYDNLLNLIKPYFSWHCFKYKLRKRKKSLNGMAKLKEKDVLKILDMHNKNYTNIEIANKFNLHKDHVQTIVAGRSWKYLTKNLLN